MLVSETKFCCDLISLVANAIATNTIEEAVEYLTTHFNEEDELVYHSYTVLNNILDKQNDSSNSSYKQ